MVSIQSSRFALLKIEGDSDDEKKNKRPQPSKTQQQKKGKGKKKGDNDQAKSNGPKPKHKGTGDAPEAQWKEWIQADKELTENFYEKDLESAIEQSRLDFEKKKTEKALDPRVTTGKKKAAGTTSCKPVTMSLDQFHNLTDPDPATPVEERPPSKAVLVEGRVPDTSFFKDVSKDAAAIVQREKHQEKLKVQREKQQEKLKQQYSAESTILVRCQEEMKKKDDEINQLTQENEKLQADLKTVKKRNQQLCVILSQGEMKDKSELVNELDELRQEKTELTQEVTRLASELEKERSKNHHSNKASKK